MSKRNREQIIKALECVRGAFVKCAECAFYHKRRLFPECRELAAKSALALIKELTQANEQLSESYDRLEKTKDELLFEKARLVLENERLMKARIALGDIVSIARDQAKTDTVRQMRERLTTFFAADDTLKYSEVDAEYINSRIDKIAKEMEER